MEKTPYELFIDAQQKIKVGKSRFNKFGNFNFRNVEDIYEAWKKLNIPLLLKLDDEVVEINGRLFMQSTATVKDNKGNVIEQSKAQAELGAGKNGMSSEQATGSASSYARKYALNGLLLLDDNVDPDTPDNAKPETKQPLTTETKQQAKTYDIGLKTLECKTADDINNLLEYAKQNGASMDSINAIRSYAMTQLKLTENKLKGTWS